MKKKGTSNKKRKEKEETDEHDVGEHRIPKWPTRKARC